MYQGPLAVHGPVAQHNVKTVGVYGSLVNSLPGSHLIVSFCPLVAAVGNPHINDISLWLIRL